MIGIDTCVLVRHFAKDDPRQAPHATRFIESLTPARRGFVPLAALVELIWVLKRQYAFTRARLSAVLMTFIESRWLMVESLATVSHAFVLFSKSHIDFGDCVIVETCRRAGCKFTYTFDRSASRQPGFRLVPQP
ncbi:PIN domain-containing protein [Cupriavidus sp. 2KB_3]|uniref:PIN domain-containing protein n=1 Tax=Cupriavidus sp. 2KB_3 TaxID=3232980 RepID=UPI003F918411